MMDLMLIGSYFIDHKARNVATGNSLLEVSIRAIDRIYGPIGRWRMRTGNTTFFIELGVYQLINSFLKRLTPSFATESSTLDIR